MSAQRALWLILCASLVWRALIAWVLPLGTDEAYALAVGRDFSLSFFDHPPIGFWLPALAEMLWAADTPLSLRIPNLLLGTIALWLLAQCGKELGGDRAMLWTAALGALAPFMAMSGLMILPDAPLYLGMTGALWALIRLSKGDDRLLIWALGGAALAVALASKYQAALLPIALFVWMIFTPNGRAWFVRPGFWLAVGLGLLGVAPVVLWNIANDWASFSFHSGRAGGGINFANFAEMVAAQLLYVSPAIALWSVLPLARSENWRDVTSRMLLLIALGPILVFNGIYLFSDGTLPHWTMPGWLVLIPLSGAWLARNTGGKARGWLLWTAVPVHLLLAALAVQAGTGLLTQGQRTVPEWDDTVPLIPLQRTRDAIAQSDILEGVELIAAKDWIVGGHLAAALGPDPAMRVLSDNPHHFGFMAGHQTGGDAVLLDIVRLDEVEQRAEALLRRARDIDTNAELIGHVPVNRGQRAYFAIVAVAITLPPAYP